MATGKKRGAGKVAAAQAKASDADFKFKTTAELKVPNVLIDQIVGQEEAVQVIKKAAKQRRHVLLIGEPGTGKSMMGMAMAELLPKEKLVSIMAFANPNDENQPLIRVVPAHQGKDIVTFAKLEAGKMSKHVNIIMIILLVASLVMPWWAYNHYSSISPILGGIMFLTFSLFGFASMVSFILFLNLGKRIRNVINVPKIVVNNFDQKTAPFYDATGAHAGALLGDVLHDPFQCIPGDELVHLPNGKPVRMAELVEPFIDSDGERSLDADEQFEVLGGLNDKFGYTATKVTKVYRRHFDSELIAVETRRGYRIRVTPNHPVAVFRPNGEIEFVLAEHITKKMLSVVPDKLPITAGGKLPTAFMYFLAETLSDGSIRDRSVAFKVRTEWKAEQYQATISALGISPKVIRRGKDIEIYAHSAELVQKLIALGAKRNGKKSIPGIIFSLPREQINEFLARYISIDGHVGKQGQFEIVSKEMIPDLTALLLKAGVRAKVRHRPDRGFGLAKGIIQPRVIFGDYEFAKEYSKLTINPTHKKNLEKYFATATRRHVSQDDNIPVEFSWLEKIRAKAGFSQTKTHEMYYALKPGLSSSQAPTRNILQAVVSKFLGVTNDESLFKLRDIVQGTFAYDEIVSVTKERFIGPVYNLNTGTGTYVVSQVLTHNTGGLGTPAHERVVAGMIHKAHMGVLFIDEIAILEPSTQQELLTALQEGRYPITGQSERSAGAMVRTEPVPCNFILVAAGNVETVARMHPALRSRVRGYGYEVYMRNTMEDTPENRMKIAQFVAQEVTKDKKIPHFTADAVSEIIMEARKRANRKGHLSLLLRDLGGIVRAAGDVAQERGAVVVERQHVLDAKRIARPLEQQIADKIIEQRKEYDVIITSGKRVGRVNGLAVLGGGATFSGIILPIEAEVVPGGEAREIIATGKLGAIAKEAVKNVSAIIKKYFGEDIKKKHDIYVQFLQTYEGVEGDSASIAVATAIISALKGIPVKQDYAMTGSLSVRGEVLPVGGVSAKVEAAVEAGITKIIVPKSNMRDIIMDKASMAKTTIIPVETIVEVLREALDWKGKESILRKIVSV